MSTRVSVVVPTYRPTPAGLDRLIRSLDAQTLPADEFEIVFVDDGSPDDTWERVQRIRESHENVRVERIENSGWPSRPRNIGLELARGEYVLFMDHDDELYPDALRAGYAMAARTGADVLNGKETRTDQSGWALTTYPANMDNSVGRTDQHPLIPTNPHKLFRRALLMEHDIRFPEGGRVPWEDVFFCLDVARHAEVVAVLADTPFYHWVREGRTSSSSFRSDRTQYWHWVREIVVQTNAKLDTPRLAGQHHLMLLHQYRSRVLTGLGGDLFRAPEAEQQMVRDVVGELLERHIPAELDAYLTPTQLGRAVLARDGRWDLMPELVAVDAGLKGVGTTTDVRWADGRLRITAEARWTVANGRTTAMRREGGRIVRDLPPHVAAALPDAALDLTAAIEQADTDVCVRGRDGKVVWVLPTRCETRVEDVDGRPALVVRATADLDPDTARMGRPLDEPVWDVQLRTDFLGGLAQRQILTDTPARTALRDDHVYIAYRNAKAGLSLDVDQTKRSLTGSAPLDADRARFERVDGDAPHGRLARLGGRAMLGRRREAWRLSVPFAAVTTTDASTLHGHVKLGRLLRTPATITARPDGAWLETTITQPPGVHPLRLLFHGRELDSGRDVVVASDGPPRLVVRG